MTDPLVSILIPAHNAEKTILAAVHSCLNQTYENFELLILNNHSIDNTLELINSIKDKRIQVFTNDSVGISIARNFLVSQAKGKYLAWLDADDIAMPNRLEMQVQFMETYPETDVLGSYVRVRGSHTLLAVKWPCGNGALQAWLRFRNPFVQSSLMIKRTANPIYDSNFDYVEDYHWLVNNKDHLELQILPEYLCSYYQSDKSIASKQDSYKQEEKLWRIWEDQLTLNNSKEKFEHIFNFLRRTQVKNPSLLLDEIKMLFNKLENKKEKATMVYLALRLLKLKPSTGSLMFCLTHLHWLPRVFKIRPRFIN